LTRRTLGSVGLLIDRKGHHLAIQALRSLPDTDLLIIGDGPQRSALESLAKSQGVSDRVRFLGLLDQTRLAEVYRAIDALVLASSREGWANVLLEAMACGTPVVASAVWGTPEVVASPNAGVLMNSLDVPGVVNGVNKLFADYPNRLILVCTPSSSAGIRRRKGSWNYLIISWDAISQTKLHRTGPFFQHRILLSLLQN
jgi:teichuronic acid biosynthesis glycosyltransferase TuaC